MFERSIEREFGELVRPNEADGAGQPERGRCSVRHAGNLVRQRAPERRQRCLLRMLPVVSHRDEVLLVSLDPRAPAEWARLAAKWDREHDANEVALWLRIRATDGAKPFGIQGPRGSVLLWNIEIRVRAVEARLEFTQIVLLAA